MGPLTCARKKFASDVAKWLLLAQDDDSAPPDLRGYGLCPACILDLHSRLLEMGATHARDVSDMLFEVASGPPGAEKPAPQQFKH